MNKNKKTHDEVVNHPKKQIEEVSELTEKEIDDLLNERLELISYLEVKNLTYEFLDWRANSLVYSKRNSKT